VKGRSRLLVFVVTGLAALVAVAVASAHAIVSPAVALDRKLQVFTLSVPTEKEGLTTSEVQLTVPAGFSIDSLAPPPAGWKMQVQSTGSGESSVVQKVTWTGGRVPTGQDAVFQFNASASAGKTYSFDVRQVYSNGLIVDWTGPESSDTPAPTIDAVSSLGGGSSSTLTIVAVALAGVALLVAIVGLVARAGGRALA
jgi:uncharacterized protein YcnI